jgi:hypothetical protein
MTYCGATVLPMSLSNATPARLGVCFFLLVYSGHHLSVPRPRVPTESGCLRTATNPGLLGLLATFNALRDYPHYHACWVYDILQDYYTPRPVPLMSAETIDSVTSFWPHHLVLEIAPLKMRARSVCGHWATVGLSQATQWEGRGYDIHCNCPSVDHTQCSHKFQEDAVTAC